MYAITPQPQDCYLRRYSFPSRHCRVLATLQTSLPTITKLKLNPNALTVAPTKLKPQHQHPEAIARPTPTDDFCLKSTWSHRAWLAAGSTSILISLAKSIPALTDTDHILEPLLAAYLGYILADLGSGVFHWAVDNYGDASTPIFGSQIEAFQGHHRRPWTITRREPANNLHALARAVLPFAAAAAALVGDPVAHAFVGVFGGCVMLSQQCHAWSHGTKSRLPAVVVALQDMGVLVPRGMHMAHHKPPYSGNYCIVSGVWNELLDKNRVFEVMEMVVFFQLGVRPRSWGETDSSWLEEEVDDDQD